MGGGPREVGVGEMGARAKTLLGAPAGRPATPPARTRPLAAGAAPRGGRDDKVGSVAGRLPDGRSEVLQREGGLRLGWRQGAHRCPIPPPKVGVPRLGGGGGRVVER